MLGVLTLLGLYQDVFVLTQAWKQQFTTHNLI